MRDSLLGWAVVLAALVAGGCAEPKSRAAAAPAHHSAERVSSAVATVAMYTLDTPLEAAGGRSLPYWLTDLELTQDGRKLGAARALVDTGAQTTVVDAKWTRGMGLALVEGDVTARDIGGRTVPTRILPDLAMALGDGAIALPTSDVIAIEFPEVLRQANIAIIWSPQTSVPANAEMTLDFADGRISVRSRSNQDETQAPPLSEALCVGTGFHHSAAIIAAEVAGIPARLEIDSGSSDTSVAMDSPAGRELAGRTSGKGKAKPSAGAAGDLDGTDLGRLPVRVEAATTTDVSQDTPVSLFRREPRDAPPQCGSDGVLGLPYLQACTLTVSSCCFRLRCDS